MKQFIFFLIVLIVGVRAEANPGPAPVPAVANDATTALANAGAVRLQFNEIVTAQDHTDSVLVIFDRYDLTGAGVIYQRYAADAGQGIDISAVPAGKYYVTIKIRGMYSDEIEKVITIKSKKSEKVRVDLKTK